MLEPSSAPERWLQWVSAPCGGRADPQTGRVVLHRVVLHLRLRGGAGGRMGQHPNFRQAAPR